MNQRSQRESAVAAFVCCGVFWGLASWKLAVRQTESLCYGVLLLASTVLLGGEIDFDREIAPLLAQRCLECHSGPEPEGELDLSTRELAFAGGESGIVIRSGNLEESLLWQKILDDKMPPKHPLSDVEKELVRSWIRSGADWGSDPIDPFKFTTDNRAGYDWWSLQPVQRPDVPPVQDHEWVANPIDSFVLETLQANGLGPSEKADRRTLIRRVSYDLLGLPPAPAEVEAFEKDVSLGAYERMIDRFLASPRYGERWARHWLDISRFGESQGFERDKLRTNSWRFRDWVIDALNQDLSYDAFARLQLAGDVLDPRSDSALTATGFLVAGAYDEVGQSQQSAAMRAVVRQDELEDYVSTIGQAFLGLTVHCARCHDHKFDPVTQKEYYQLAAALSGVRPGQRNLSTPGRIPASFNSSIAFLERELAGLDDPLRARVLAERQTKSALPPVPVGRWEFDEDSKGDLGGFALTLHGAAEIRNGRLQLGGADAFATTEALNVDLGPKTIEVWLQLHDLRTNGGAAVSVQSLDGRLFDALVFGDGKKPRWLIASTEGLRTRSLGGPDEVEAQEQLTHLGVVFERDGTVLVYRNGQPYGKSYPSPGVAPFEADNVQLVFGARNTPHNKNQLLNATIDRVNLYNRALLPEEIAASAGVETSFVSDRQIIDRLSPEQVTYRERLKAELAHLILQRDRLSATKIYAVAPKKAEVVHVLNRGNPADPLESVSPAGVASVRGVDARFNLDAQASEGQRRRSLAEWVANDNNPLFARVIVNRLWQYHFGRGLVETPSDFGFNGGRPSHPELLDWLAAEIAARDWSLKAIHKVILMSSTYRQASQLRPEAASVDAGNRLLWRKSPRRLEAEVLRDAILSVCGQLNAEIGGPGYYDFTTYVHNTQFYTMVDPVGHSFNRRSLYRTWVRSGRNAFLDVFDCPDPSAKAPMRAVTTTPLQSLSLMNNSFALRMADRFAERLRKDAGADVQSQVERAFELAYSRKPKADEIELSSSLIAEHGLSAFGRVIFNSSEYLYVE